MKDLLIRHIKDTQELDSRIINIKNKINKCKSFCNNRRLYNAHATTLLTSELELEISNVTNLLNECFENHKIISRFVHKRYNDGVISDNIVAKTDNYTAQLKKYKDEIYEFEFTIDNDLYFT